MPEEGLYVLPKKKHDSWTLVGFGVLIARVVLIGVVAEDLRERWVFGHITGAQHLSRSASYRFGWAFRAASAACPT